MDIESLRTHLADAMAAEDEAGYIALMHPDLVFTTVAFGDQEVFRGQAGAREWWGKREEAVVYDIYSAHVERISPHAIVIEARMRHSETGQGMEDANAMWLVVEKDGLVWRYQPVDSKADALTILETLG